MSLELFEITTKAQLSELDQIRVTYLRDQLSYAESLDLEAQALSITTDIATVERGRLIITPPLTEAELTIWRAWLPTVYTDVGDDMQHQLANYNFDRIPQPVLKIWDKHKESGTFERFEIWTPESHVPDPILIGVNGNTRHLLARWGESDANLISFSDIKIELKRRWLNNEYIIREPLWKRECCGEHAFMVALLSSTTIFILAVFGLPNILNSPEIGLTISGAIALVVGFISFRHYRRRAFTKLSQSSDLMQALAKESPGDRALLTTT